MKNVDCSWEKEIIPVNPSIKHRNHKNFVEHLDANVDASEVASLIV